MKAKDFAKIITKYQQETGKTLTSKTQNLTRVHTDFLKRGIYNLSYRSFMYDYRAHFKNETPEGALERKNKREFTIKAGSINIPEATLEEVINDKTQINFTKDFQEEIKTPVDSTLFFIIMLIVSITVIIMFFAKW